VVLAIVGLSVPAAAQAQVTCRFNATTKVMDVGVDNDAATLSTSSGNIVVTHGLAEQIACVDSVNTTTEVFPTVGGTEAVNIDGNPAFNATAVIQNPAAFVHAGNLQNPDEIEFDVDLGNAANPSDHLVLSGGNGADHWLADASGIDINPRDEIQLNGQDDDIKVAGAYDLEFNLGAGNDTFSGQGIDDGTPTPSTQRLWASGDFGTDTVEGGNGIDDRLDGGSLFNSDQLSGTDTLSYARSGTGITIALDNPNPQNTNFDDGGEGTDQISDFDNVTGSSHSDAIFGDSGNNLIQGGDGVDQIEARLGNDLVDGGPGNVDDNMFGEGGTDTVTYASAGAGVTVNLSNQGMPNQPPTGGAGTDGLNGFENLTGSPFNDVLSGDPFANVLSGGGGNDVISPGGGNDTAFGGIGNDILNGGDNNDTVQGDAGNDKVKGGTGKDTLLGNAGFDKLKARDNKRDRKINCGSGSNAKESASFDAGKDPAPQSC
jgi:Ca2+-binding RTX toxin-like protein